MKSLITSFILLLAGTASAANWTGEVKSKSVDTSTITASVITTASATVTGREFSIGGTDFKASVGNITIAGTGASVLDIGGGMNAGTGNVGIIDATGKIPALSSTYLTSVSGANLTSLTAQNVAAGTFPSNVIASSIAVQTVYPGAVQAGTYNIIATTATNLANGLANQLHIQTSPGISTFVAAPGANTVLWGNSGAPSWTNTPTFLATNVTGLPATSVNAGSLGSSVIASSIAVQTVYPAAVQNATYAMGISGNAGTVTNGVYTNGSYTNPSWITSLSTSKVDLSTVTTALAGKLSNTATVSTTLIDLSTVTTALAGKAPVNSPTFTGTVGGITATMVGLGNVPNLAFSGSNTGDNAVNSNYSGLVTNATHTGDVTGAGALTVVHVPASAVDLSTVTTALSGKQATGNYITALTGNVTASGPGSATATIASLPAISGASLTSLTAANISAGTAGISISGNAATVTNGLYTSTNFSGDVSGAYNAIAVTNDSHSHSNATISGLDESKLSGTFNSANHVVKLEATGKYPAADGSQLTNLPSTSGGAVLAATQTFTGANTFNSSTTFVGSVVSTITYLSGIVPMTVTVYTSGSGTYTPPAKARKLKVTAVGGGGGGSGSSNSSGSGGGGGGGGGGTVIAYINNPSGSYAYSVGAGGNGGAWGGAGVGGNGFNGGISSFTATYYATGGGAGIGNSGTSPGYGGRGGVGNGGSINVYGSYGGTGTPGGGISGVGGHGGNSTHGGGGGGASWERSFAGRAGDDYGGGGGGGSYASNGGNGAGGLIIIEEYY